MNASQFPSIGTVAEQTDLLPEEGSRPEISAASAELPPIEQIESMCMSCGGNGTTRLLLTSIPYFREIIIMSFSCDDCGDTNSEVQSAGKIQDQGIHYRVAIQTCSDLDRQIVKSPTCTIVLPEFEFTIPAGRGQLTNMEGILRDAVQDLSIDQPLRKIQDKATYQKIEALLDAFRLIVPDNQNSNLVSPQPLQRAFTVELDDPSGNSFIEFVGSMADPQWCMNQYHRSEAQSAALGVTSITVPTLESGTLLPSGPASHMTDDEEESDTAEILVFPGSCPGCGCNLDTLMKKVSIPYFKEIFIMSTTCETCGYKDNEVKAGAAISEYGKRIELLVESEDDLARDVLKSDTCGLQIPDIDLTLEPGTLGGRFTTLEGIIDQIYSELSSKVFASEDAIEEGNALKAFLRKLESLKSVHSPFTFILDDPLANSYLQNLYAPDTDPNMTTLQYKRTWQQDDELGLNDIKVEDYNP